HPAAHRRCLRLRLEEGQEVTISEDHSLFTVDPLTARPVPVTGARVETGTPIVVPVDLSGSAAAWPRDLSFIDLRELVRSRNGHGGRGARGARDGLGSNRGGPAQVLLGVPASDEVLYGIGLGLADGGTGLASGECALAQASHPLIDDTSRCFALDGIFPSVREGSDSRRLLCLSRARDRQRFLELYPLRLLSTHTAALGRPRTNGRDEAAS